MCPRGVVSGLSSISYAPDRPPTHVVAKTPWWWAEYKVVISDRSVDIQVGVRPPRRQAHANAAAVLLARKDDRLWIISDEVHIFCEPHAFSDVSVKVYQCMMSMHDVDQLESV